MSAEIADTDVHTARVLDADDRDDRRMLQRLRMDPRIEFLDRGREQAAELRLRRPTADGSVSEEPMQWAYYPWRRTVVRVLGPRAFRAVRLDRNRHLITEEEQRRLTDLRIGVIGCSAGHAAAHMLAAEGLCGELRLADFDSLELSNLNRVPATVFDLGTNKAILTARRIAELDPYLRVRVLTCALTAESVNEFLDGLDIVVEECDSLDIKVVVREAARARRVPVLMATTDRGLFDVERYDLQPARPVLHGLLDDVDTTRLSNLTTRDKIPHVLRVLDGAQLSSRGAASLIEVGQTLSTWPQLAADVAGGAILVAEAVRRIGLGEPLSSGRVRSDFASALEELAEPPKPPELRSHVADDIAEPSPSDFAEAVAAAAVRAPSGGNAQPWHLEMEERSVVLRVAPERTTTMDVNFRASAVALGAAAFNAQVAAAAYGAPGTTVFAEDDDNSPLRAVVRIVGGVDTELARLYRPMILRETNRHHGSPCHIPAQTVRLLESAAGRAGARLQILAGRDVIEKAATILAAADRIRYLTPRLHSEMVSELRWPGNDSYDSGIDVRSLELDPGGFLALDILRRPDVMANLAQWGMGEALGADTRARVAASSAVAVLSVNGHALTDYARGGSAVEAVWIIAQQHGLAVQPLAPVFLYAQNPRELSDLSPTFAPCLSQLQGAFRELAHTGPDESQVVALRFFDAPRASVRSRRRSLTRISSPVG